MEYLRTFKPLFTSPHHRIPIRCIKPRYCSNGAHTSVTSTERKVTDFKYRVSSGPSFQDFIKGVSVNKTYVADGEYSDKHAYLCEDLDAGNSRKGWSASLKAIKLVTLNCLRSMLNKCYDFMFQFILKPMAVK